MRPATLGIGGWEAPSPHPHPRDRQKKPREFPPARGWSPALTESRGVSADKPPPEGMIFLRDPKLCRPPCGGRVVEVDDVVHEEELSHSPPAGTLLTCREGAR